MLDNSVYKPTPDSHKIHSLSSLSPHSSLFLSPYSFPRDLFCSHFPCSNSLLPVIFISYPASSSPFISYSFPIQLYFLSSFCYFHIFNLILYIYFLFPPNITLSLLTLRRLMSYIYIYIYIYMEHPFLMFLDHTQRRSTVGRTPLDE